MWLTRSLLTFCSGHFLGCSYRINDSNFYISGKSEQLNGNQRHGTLGIYEEFCWKQKLQVPLCVEISWIMGGHMDLDFDLLETVSIAFAIIITAFALQVCHACTPVSSTDNQLTAVSVPPFRDSGVTCILHFHLQDGTSHYMKGLALCLSYVIIAACFFFCGTLSSSPPFLSEV